MNVVYTAIFGHYDTLRPPEVVDSAWRYVVFTDSPFNAPSPWEVHVLSLPHLDPRYASRYCFDQSTVLLPDAEYTVMHGANGVLLTAPTPLLSFVQTRDIAVYLHPHRVSVYAEPAAIALLHKDDENADLIALQMERYQEAGFHGVPFHACGLLVRRNTRAVQAFERLWWAEVQQSSYRDQLAFNYAAWKTGLAIADLTPGNMFNNPYLRIYAHQS